MVQVSKKAVSPPPTPRQAVRRRHAIDSLLDPDLFKALGDPTRVGLLACLAKCGRFCSVGEVAECCSVDLSVVSRHLKLLEQADILDSEKQGRSVRYRVRFGELSAALRSLADAIDTCCPAGTCDESGCTDGCC
jgi:ArsR family transcriptional regulator, arsenate/arsenite/antimonite-responsive transcriptional repressor